MSTCVNEIMMDLGFDCANPPVKGLEKEILLINRNDIDFGASQLSDNKITSLVLKSGKKGYVARFAKDTHISVATKPEFSDDELNGHRHSVGLRIYGKTVEECNQIDKLVAGASLVAVVQNKGKGTNAQDAFDVYGWFLGLEATEGEGRTNGGEYILTLSTPSGQKEPKNVLRWLETDYTTTKTKFDNKLA